MTSPYEPIKKPPDFTTSDESLVEDEIAKAPFEVSALRRLQLAGWPAPKVMDTLHMSLAAVLNAINMDRAGEKVAERDGRPIYKGTI